MRRSQIVMLIGVVLIFMGLGAVGRNTGSQQAVDVNDGEETPTIAVTNELPPTMVVATPTAQPEPTATVVIQSEYAGQLVWQDTFDDTASGWEPLYTASSKRGGAVVNKTAYNGYENGSYRFVLNNKIDNRNWLLWDFNTVQQLPSYPYAVEVDVRATRDHTGALILDYRGDVGNLDNGDGVFVRFHLGEAPTTPKQAWGLLGIDQGDERLFAGLYAPFASDLYALEVYESLAGQRYVLACDQLMMPLVMRMATLRVEVDATLIYATLTDRNNPNNAVNITCKRPANAPTTSSSTYMGLVGIHTERIVPVQIDYALDFEEIRVLSIDTVAVSGENITNQPIKLVDSDCNTEFVMSIRTRLVSYTNTVAFCAALGDWGIWEIPIIRYEQKADQLLGRWQCGNDPEGVIELAKQDWRTTIRFANQELAYLYTVPYTHLTGSQPHLVVWDNSATQPGDTLSSLPTYFLAYTDTDLVASWAGKCARIQ
jgi:hypothetical protein